MTVPHCKNARFFPRSGPVDSPLECKMVKNVKIMEKSEKIRGSPEGPKIPPTTVLGPLNQYLGPPKVSKKS